MCSAQWTTTPGISSSAVLRKDRREDADKPSSQRRDADTVTQADHHPLPHTDARAQMSLIAFPVQWRSIRPFRIGVFPTSRPACVPVWCASLVVLNSASLVLNSSVTDNTRERGRAGERQVQNESKEEEEDGVMVASFCRLSSVIN